MLTFLILMNNGDEKYSYFTFNNMAWFHQDLFGHLGHAGPRLKIEMLDRSPIELQYKKSNKFYILVEKTPIGGNAS